MRKKQSSYTEKELLEYLAQDIVKGKLSSLYNEYYVKDKKIPVSDNKKIIQFDFIADYLLKHKVKELFERNISKITRNETYKQESHYKKGVKKEKWLAKLLFDSELEPLGKIIDYETPINGIKGGGAGEVDLLAYNEKKNQLSLIELKLKKNNDTMLHTILQICTYYCQIDKKQLAKDFGKPLDASIQKVILIFKDSPQYQQYKKSKYIQELAKEMDVTVYALDYKLFVP